ncbi:hypothetical protein [Antarctobacter sp.]|uniref:hypothetical protein n=1 Tax=Antarctobacter sp. TaxID=1872577 RepID=UPI003A92FD70
MSANPLITLTLFAVTTTLALPATAQDQTKLVDPEDLAYQLPEDATELEKNAYAVLDEYCSGCHQQGKLKNGLTQPKSGFGHVLDIRRLAHDPKHIAVGDPNASKLYQVVTGGAPLMPDNCYSPDCAPDDTELKHLKDWIVALGETAPEPRPFISLADIYAMAHEDLQKQPTNRRDRVRYISMRTMWNDARVTDETFEAYRGGAVKLLNALSWNPNVYRFEQVDPHGVLLRVFLPDLDWTPETWDGLEDEYPYAMESDVDPYLDTLQQISGTEIPVIRADWFAATASVSPLYYDILGLPDSFQGLQDLLGFDLDRNIRDGQVIRAGFQDSGVSTNNRLIERHPLGTGFFWTSYDFSASAGRKSFFEFPLGPASTFGDEFAFEQDGGESIFTLPNGFHAYYLNTADGKRLNVGPTQIVRDTDYPEGTGEVVNGISCISCHSKGIRLNDDIVREVARANKSLPPAAHQIIDQIYPGKDEVNEYFQRDMKAFLDTLDRAGIDPSATAAGLEPVRGLFVYHVDYFVTFDQAASELGLRPDELRSSMAFVGPQFAGLITRLDLSPIARDEWEAAFPVLLQNLTNYRPLRTDYVSTAKLSYSTRQVVKDTPYDPAAVTADAGVTGGERIKTAEDAVKYGAGYDPMQHSSVVRSRLTVYATPTSVKVNEEVKIFVEPREDCRLTLISIDDDHDSCILFPMEGFEDKVIPGGSQFIYPPRGTMTSPEPGLETILAICNGNQAAIEQATRNTNQVSCTKGHQAVTRERYSAMVNETFVTDPDADPQVTRKTDSGVDFRALSSHNPDVAQAQVSVVVRDE